MGPPKPTIFVDVSLVPSHLQPWFFIGFAGVYNYLITKGGPFVNGAFNLYYLGGWLNQPPSEKYMRKSSHWVKSSSSPSFGVKIKHI